MENVIVLVAYLFVMRPPVPNQVQIKNNVVTPKFQLSLEQFFSFPILAILMWYWWWNQSSDVDTSWEIVSVVFLKALVVACTFLYQQTKGFKTSEQKQKIITAQIVAFILLCSIYTLLLVFGRYRSLNADHFPIFGAFLFTIYLIIFGAFQFDYIHLEDDIVI